MTKRALADLWFTNKFARQSALFETGSIQDASTDNAFVLRLNALVAASVRNGKLQPPGDLAAAILTGGKLNEHAELVVFGHWLFADNMPGLPSKGGRQVDRPLVLKTVAAAMAELRARPDLAEDESGIVVSSAPTTKNDLARRWKGLFQEPAQPKQFDARLKSMRRILPAYLNYLQSGKMEDAGKLIKSSPQIKKILDAITRSSAKTKTGAAIPKVSVIAGDTSSISAPTTPVPDFLASFEIELGYSSTNQEAEYRNAPAGSYATSTLRYQPTRVASTSKTGNVRNDIEGRAVLEPELAIRDKFKVKALIDRMAILVNVNDITSWTKIKNAIDREVGAVNFVHDLTIPRVEGKPDWRDQIPNLDLSKKTELHFAIMIQEPNPKILAEILDLIDHNFGIDGEITPFLLEMSVDFYPRDPGSPEEAILLREQMVGLLQRHHCASHDQLICDNPDTPANADARQVYGKKSKQRYLFSRKRGDRISSDAQIKKDVVRKRILDANPGNDLYLDATVYKGIKLSPFLISIQNKIADRRNQTEKTMKVLADEERRARIEVTITGSEQLQGLGFATINDLAGLSFRKIWKSLLHFRLGTLNPQQHLFDEAIQQMKTRGIYGMELKERARHQEERKQVRLATGKTPRSKDREGLGLVDWPEMNSVVGHALDGLENRWSGFSLTGNGKN